MKEKETKDNNNTFDAYKSKSPVILQRQGFLKHISYPERESNPHSVARTGF